MRLYDIEEGEILIDGRDIRTLQLADLRQSVSVLFQDYTHFPLSVRPYHYCHRYVLTRAGGIDSRQHCSGEPNSCVRRRPDSACSQARRRRGVH